MLGAQNPALPPPTPALPFRLSIPAEDKRVKLGLQESERMYRCPADGQGIDFRGNATVDLADRRDV